MAQVRNGPEAQAIGPFAFMWRAATARNGLALLLALMVIVPAPARAWGRQGHRISALFADTLLTPRSRAQVQRLTGALSLVDFANWADEYRPGLALLLEHSDRWHYDDRPICDAAAPVSSYCADGNCASAALQRFEAQLSDPRASDDQRAVALRYVVHLIGDIHQPMHVGDNGDAGGNHRMVALPGAQPRNLHSVWDTSLLQRMLRGTNEQALAEELREYYDVDIADWQRGTVRDWMNESYAIAQRNAYGALPGFQCGVTPASVTPLPDAYVHEAQSEVARQLARAGARIAGTLNRIFDFGDSHEHQVDRYCNDRCREPHAANSLRSRWHGRIDRHGSRHSGRSGEKCQGDGRQTQARHRSRAATGEGTG